MAHPRPSALRSVSLLLALAASTAFARPQVYGESAMVKVRPNTPPHADAGVTLVAARNELISFQVVVHGGDTGLTGVRAQLPGLTGPSTLSGPSVTLYREEFLDVRTPTFPTSETGRWPDALVPDVDEISGEQRGAFPFHVPPGESRAVWVDVLVPMAAPPGAYAGEVHVSGEAFDARVPVTLEVVPVTLPSTPSLASAFLLWMPNVCQAHTGSPNCGGTAQTAALVERYQRMALEHRITLSNPLTHAGNWSAFDAQHGPYLDGTAPTRLPGARMTSLQYVGRRDAQSYAAFAAHMAEKGWLDRAYDYTFDEPWAESHFTEIARRVAIVRDGAPKLRTLVTTDLASSERFGVTGLIDHMVPMINDLDGTVAPNAGDQRSRYDGYMQGPQKRLWTYQCCRGHGCVQGPIPPENVPGSGWPSYMVDTSAAKNRAMQWLAFRERVTGELYYETAMALPRAWTDQYEFGGNGDGTLFYPGTPARIGGQTDVPVASIRLKLIRSGMQDYELLKMVSDAGDPGFAQRIVDAVVPASHRVPDDGAVFEAARLKLLRRLVELRPDAWQAPGAGNPPDTGSPPDVEKPLPHVGGGGGCSAAGTASLIPLALILLAGLLGKRGVLVPVRVKPVSGGGRGARRGKAAPGGR